MINEPRHADEYEPRQVEAAHRVLVDLGQVLASYKDSLVIVGGWAPDLVMRNTDEPHIGSIDVDLALDAARLSEGQYAALIESLLNTRRYKAGVKPFQLVAEVDLKDGGPPVVVEVDFLAPRDVKLKKNKPKLLKDFRVLQAEGCDVAFESAVEMTVAGENISGAENSVQLRIVSPAGFLIMKAYAVDLRDKPKDVYDLCYVLENAPGGMEALASAWKKHPKQAHVAYAKAALVSKFQTVASFGPQQLVEFHNSANDEEREMQARRAYELVQKFLSLLEEE